MKKLILSLLVVVVLGILGIIAYVKTALPNVGPPPDIQVEGNADQIERGRYLAYNVCACMDCHSTRDWSKLAGPLVSGTLGKGGEAFTEEFGFPGSFYSKNITPSALGSWTDGEIYRAITSGVSKDGSALFPVMPYLNYGKMDIEDIKAIIAYLRTLAPIENKTPASIPSFPMNIIINTIPQKPNHIKIPEKTDILEYGKYLVNASACSDCHTKQEKGEKMEGMELAGGFEFVLPTGTVRSANITPDETGIKGWTKQAFVNRFKAYADSGYVDPLVGNGFQTVMPWKMYAGMSDEDLGAIFEYLKTVAPVSNSVVRFTKK